MHLAMILIALGLAVGLRQHWQRPEGHWQDRWQQTLATFLLAPLLLLVTAVTVMGMGMQGRMLGLSVSWAGYAIALGFLGFSSVWFCILTWQGGRSLRQVRTYPLINLQGHLPGERHSPTGRLLNMPMPFAAQIGFWRPELVLSRGLLQQLNAEQLQAVLIHERAHYHYRDTFCFFWLGWLRQMTFWLPNTEALWQDLLLLRELRADSWAARQVDPLLLAEALLLVAKAPMMDTETYCAAFSSAAPINRLEERIEALIAPPDPLPSAQGNGWIWLLLTLLPLLTLPLHQ